MLEAIVCFNPCFNGTIISTLHPTILSTLFRNVSILVLMELSFQQIKLRPLTERLVEFQSLF